MAEGVILEIRYITVYNETRPDVNTKIKADQLETKITASLKS